MQRSFTFALLCFSLLLFSCRPVAAQFDDKKEAEPGGAKLDAELVQRYRVGVVVKATGGSPTKASYATIPMPIEWPEQKVRIVDEELSDSTIRVRYKNHPGMAKQMIVSIPMIRPGEKATATVTVEVRRRSILAPDDTSIYSIPTKEIFTKQRELRNFMGNSPFIETSNRKIKDQAKDIVKAKADATDWQKVEALYDWVRANVEYKDGPLKGALRALQDGDGDCEELTSLFIAFCRNIDVPARTVWIPGHCYPEFYLVDKEGAGHWFPCQAAGTRAFGEMPEHRPILQKGDNFRDPDRPREKMRYLSEHFTCKLGQGAGNPRVQFIRELLADDEQTESTGLK